MKFKNYIENKKKKREEYWNNLDLDRQLKIEMIKESRARQDHESSKSLLKFFVALSIPLLITPIFMISTALATHWYNEDSYQAIIHHSEK